MEPSSRNRRPLLIVAAIAGVGLLGFVAFGVFGVHLLFIDEEVAEAAPVFTATTVDDDEQASDETSDVGADVVGADVVETDDGASTGDVTTPDEPAPVVPMIAAAGTFVDGDHPTSGTANVLTDGALQRVLRLEEDFATDNGPDLNVYLASSADVGDDYIDLGDLKGNLGSQNYEIPGEVDLAVYDTVVIWCVRFGVAFGSSELLVG